MAIGISQRKVQAIAKLDKSVCSLFALEDYLLTLEGISWMVYERLASGSIGVSRAAGSVF